jgi:hypothetical protein
MPHYSKQLFGIMHLNHRLVVTKIGHNYLACLLQIYQGKLLIYPNQYSVHILGDGKQTKIYIVLEYVVGGSLTHYK